MGVSSNIPCSAPRCPSFGRYRHRGAEGAPCRLVPSCPSHGCSSRSFFRGEHRATRRASVRESRRDSAASKGTFLGTAGARALCRTLEGHSGVKRWCCTAAAEEQEPGFVSALCSLPPQHRDPSPAPGLPLLRATRGGAGAAHGARVRTGDPGSSSMRTREDFDTSAATACRNAALIPFLCCAVRAGSVRGCCTAVQAALSASLASPTGLWHMFFLSFVYCVP